METNKTYSYQAKTMKEVEAVLNVFCTEQNVFSTQIFPILDNGTSIGYDVLVWYKETSSYLPQEMEGLTNYDRAKLNKTTTQETPATKQVKMASQKQIDYALSLGYKGSIENLTAKNAFNIIQSLKEKK
jgi:hypothetical protein